MTTTNLPTGVNSIFEFQIPDIGGVKEATHDKNSEMEKHRNTLIQLHFGVSDTERLRSQESRLFNIGVPDLRNPEA
jgi:hypothetical protein